MHLAGHISESIRQMGSSDIFTTDMSEWLQVTNVKEAYQSSNKVNYIRQMLKHNDWCTGLDYMEETLSYLALQDWYNIDSAKVFNLLSATDSQQSTHRAHQLHLQTIEDKPFICPVLQQVYHLREMYVCGVCRSIKLTLLRDSSEDFGIPNFGQLCCTQIQEEQGHEFIGFVLGYDQNVLKDSISINLQNGLVLPSTISQPYFCLASGTWLEGRIYQCQPRDHACSLYYMGTGYAKWRRWPR